MIHRVDHSPSHPVVVELAQLARTRSGPDPSIPVDALGLQHVIRVGEGAELWTIRPGSLRSASALRDTYDRLVREYPTLLQLLATSLFLGARELEIRVYPEGSPTSPAASAHQTLAMRRQILNFMSGASPSHPG